MADALYHPKHGYYMTRDPFGCKGDFTTAPEISQMFGELIGAWLTERWQEMGEPSTIFLIELGPGRGTMMVDALHGIRSQSKFRNAISIHLLEISPLLRDIQKISFAGMSLPAEKIYWHTDSETLPDGPLLVIANEFFDALPIHQFERTKAGWCERLIELDNGRFQFTLGGALSENETCIPKTIRENATLNSIFEIRPAATAITTQIATQIARFGGAALIFDYGNEVSTVGDTLQSVRGHAVNEVLSNSGSADLTAHLDFAALERSIRGLVDVYGPINQGIFLRQLGIEIRTEALTKNATESQSIDIINACRRLTEHDQMGGLFKVMALTSHGLNRPSGFVNNL